MLASNEEDASRASKRITRSSAAIKFRQTRATKMVGHESEGSMEATPTDKYMYEGKVNMVTPDLSFLFLGSCEKNEKRFDIF